jgi:hypothetical protein
MVPFSLDASTLMTFGMPDNVATTASSQASHDIVSQRRWYCLGFAVVSSFGVAIAVAFSMGVAMPICYTTFVF